MRPSVASRAVLLGVVALAVVGAADALALCGDGNDDGRVSVSDGVQTLRAAARLGSSCDTDCDVDGSGTITVSDGVNVLRMAAGLPAVQQCPNAAVESLLANTLVIFGPLTKIRAIGGASAAGTTSPCDNPGGGFQQSASGFVFDDCEIDGVTFTGFLASGNGQLGFNDLVVARLGDVVTLAGSLNVGDAGGNSELNGVLDGDSQELGSYAVTFQQVVTGSQGETLDGILDFDTSAADIPNVAQITVTLTGGTSLPVVVRFDDDSTQNYTYDTTTDELTPVDGPIPTPTATPLPTTRVRISNIDDRITTFLNGKQVLQAQSSGPNATQDTGFQVVDGLECGDNLFEFLVENTVPGSGYTFRVQLEVGGSTIVDRSCGQVGVQGCDDNNQTQGLVAHDATFFCFPCAPCTAGAGSCAQPLVIPGNGRIQIHGRVAGPNGFSGPCGGAGGPESVFRFTPTVSGCYEFSTCGTSFDSQLSLGDAFCGGGDGPITEQCLDDNRSCTDGTSREYQFGSFDAGVPITLVLDSEGSQGGSYTFDVRPSGACIF